MNKIALYVIVFLAGVIFPTLKPYLVTLFKKLWEKIF